MLLDYQPGRPPPVSKRAIFCLILALAPYAAFGVFASLELIDYFGPGIPFFHPLVLAAFLFHVVLVEGVALAASLRIKRLIAASTTVRGQSLVRYAIQISGVTLAGAAVVWVAYLYLELPL